MTTTQERPGVLGQRLLRREDPALLTGEAKFTNDIQVTGALYLAVLRSPYAHARITSVDVSGALGGCGCSRGLLGSRPGRSMGRPDAVRVARHRRHEEPGALPARDVEGVLCG